MYNILMVALIVISILLILLVVMQPSKSNAASSLAGGAGDQLHGRQKARGFEAFLIKATTILGIAFFVVALALAFLSSQV